MKNPSSWDIGRPITEYLVVDTAGRVLYKPPYPAMGVVVCAEADSSLNLPSVPLLRISEVSDESVLNLFIDTLGETSPIQHFPEYGDGATNYQLLAKIASRKDGAE